MGVFDEDVGSTLFFDRRSLRRFSEAQQRAATQLTPEQPDEEPLVCVATKRIRLTPLSVLPGSGYRRAPS